MATGEKSFNTADAKKTKRNFDPIKAGDWDLKLLGKASEIRTAEPKKNEKTGKVSQPKPRVSIRFEAIGSGEDGGKNKLLFHDLYTDMTPDKGGTIAPTGADQLKGLADALGTDADIPFTMFLPKGATEKVKILDPRALKKWLEDHDGEVVRAHVKVQAGTKEYPEPKNKITEFFEAGAGQTEDAGSGDDEGIPDMDGDSGDDALDESDLEEPKNEKKGKKPVGKKR